jgi:hypothetical protein
MTVKFAVLIISASALAGCPTVEQINARDDATCQSWGTSPGTEPYFSCRSQLALQAQLSDMQRRSMAMGMAGALLSR